MYHYNSDGIRVAEIVDGLETRYLIDANQAYAQVLSEYTPGGTVGASYVYGYDLISQNRSGVQSFYEKDGLGSTTALTNITGNVTDTYTYDAFGNLIGSTGSTVNNYCYAGEQYDSNLGDYYLRARYYDTSVGRFIRKDSFDGSQEDPISLHKYLYANGNPVNSTDPSGLFVGSLEEFEVADVIAADLDAQVAPSIATTTTLSADTFPTAVGSTTWNGANWVLYDASGAVLAAPNASSPNFQVTLAANGVYTLAIVGSSSNPVNYSFTVTDNSAAASTNSGFGALQTLSVNSNQVVDYNFTASAGTILLYDSRDEQNGNNYYLRVRLVNPDGTYVFDGQDERYDTAPIVLTQSGNYKLQVYNADTTRVANFQLLQLPKNLGPGTNYLQMDSPVTGTLNHAESKVYTFQAVNGLKVLLNGMAGATNYTLYDFADGTHTSNTYDALGQKVASTDQMGMTTHDEYDALGRLTAVVDTTQGRTTYDYDKAGNLISQTDALGRTTHFEYDALNRRTATVSLNSD